MSALKDSWCLVGTPCIDTHTQVLTCGHVPIHFRAARWISWAGFGRFAIFAAPRLAQSLVSDPLRALESLLDVDYLPRLCRQISSPLRRRFLSSSLASPRKVACHVSQGTEYEALAPLASFQISARVAQLRLSTINSACQQI